MRRKNSWEGRFRTVCGNLEATSWLGFLWDFFSNQSSVGNFSHLPWKLLEQHGSYQDFFSHVALKQNKTNNKFWEGTSLRGCLKTPNNFPYRKGLERKRTFLPSSEKPSTARKCFYRQVCSLNTALQPWEIGPSNKDLVKSEVFTLGSQHSWGGTSFWGAPEGLNYLKEHILKCLHEQWNAF